MQMNNVQALGLNLCYTCLDLILSEKIGRSEHLMHLKFNGGFFNGNLVNSLTHLSWIFWRQPPPLFFKRTNVHLKNVVFLKFSHSDLMDDSTLRSVIKVSIIFIYILFSLKVRFEYSSIEFCFHFDRWHEN